MQEILNKKQAIEQAGGKTELARDLFQMLLAELPASQQALQEAIQAGDFERMWDVAHRLYGSTAYCAVPALREQARLMELAIKLNDLQQIEAQFSHLLTAIQQLLEQGPRLLQDSW